MARLNEDSNLSGKLGNTVYVRLKNGQTILRSMPKVNPDKRTPAQLRNQERFRLIHKFCAPFKQSVIPQIWNDAATTDNGYNLFVKTNTPAFGPDGELLDAKKIRLSTGSLPLAEQIQVQPEADGSGKVKVSWQKTSHQGGLTLQDELMVVSARENEYSDIQATGITRGSLGGSFVLPEQPANVSHLYLFFASHDRRQYSDSVCFELGQ